MAQPRALTERDEKAIAKAYAANTPTAQLAAEYGVHADTIRNIAKRAGLTMRNRGGMRGPTKVKT